MFSGRQVEIIKLILDNNHGVNGSALADALNVSSRTIRNEISGINAIYEKALIHSNNKKGYTINDQYKKDVRKMVGDISHHDDMRSRNFEILGKIILEKVSSIEELSEGMAYSSQTIRKDIYKLAEELKRQYDVSLFSMGSEKVSITAKEDEIRETLFKIIKDAITSNRDDYQKLVRVILNDGFSGDLFDQILEAIDLCCERCGIKISMENIKILQSAILICVCRNQNGFISDELYESHDDFLMQLLGYIESLYINDLFLLHKLIHTFKITKGNDEIEVFDFSRVVLDEFIDEVFDKYNFNLKESKDLYGNMLVHIEYMLRRVESGYELRNPIINDIKRKYPFAYEVSMLIVHIVYKYKNKYIYDDEVSYLAIYVEHYLENINEKIRAILISSQRHSINQVIEKWVEVNFTNQITIQKTIDKSRMKAYNLEAFDLILSINDQIYTTDIDAFVFNGLPDMNDINRLNESIHAFKLNQRIKKTMAQFVDPLLIKLYEESSFEEVISDLSRVMQEKGIVLSAKEFMEDVINREINYPTNLDDTLMIPHPLYTFANKTALAIGVVKKGFSHNGVNIKLVFLLAIEKVRNSDVNFIFQFFKQISSNKTLLKNLYDSESEEELISNMLKFNMLKK